MLMQRRRKRLAEFNILNIFPLTFSSLTIALRHEKSLNEITQTRINWTRRKIYPNMLRFIFCLFIKFHDMHSFWCFFAFCSFFEWISIKYLSGMSGKIMKFWRVELFIKFLELFMSNWTFGNFWSKILVEIEFSKSRSLVSKI